MISKMSCSLSIRLLISIVVFLPWCFRGCVMSSMLPQDDDLKSTNNSNQFQNLDIQNLEESIIFGTKQMSIHSNFEDLLLNPEIKNESPEYGQFIDSEPTAEGYLESLNAEIIIEASQNLMDSYCSKLKIGSSQECAKQLTKVKLIKTSMGEKCLSMYYNQTACAVNNMKYRTIDGSCNNLKRSFLGKANTAYKRLLFPDYDNGINELKKLPNPRTLSTSLVDDKNSTDRSKTIAMAYWATFISHDLSKTAITPMQKTNKPVMCCSDDGQMKVPSLRHRLCASIKIPEADRINTLPKGEGCMNYVRSVAAMRTDCTFGPREQANVVTHYLDGSMIYGSSVQQMLSLRNKSNGQLTWLGGDDVQRPSNYPNVLPMDYSTACQFGPGTCFLVGDSRENAQPQLALLHTLWMREHNRLANRLAMMNRHWDDERTFQEARKIVTAYIQHITYNEWLPALLGSDYTKHNKLELLSEGYSDAYDETADPSISNGFATGVLPFVNSMYDEAIGTYIETGKNLGDWSLKEFYNQPSNIVGMLILTPERFIYGLSKQSTQKVDMKFSKTMTDFLFSNNSYGMDVMSLTIQRSRDHGIPSYVEYRKYCGLKDVSNHQDLNSVMVGDASFRLMKQYKTVEDIELFIGALFERHEDDAMVGPTMRCIIREQFIRTRIADSYFYDLPGVFTEPQLAEIRKISLARIICDNKHYEGTTIQRHVFERHLGSKNRLLYCESELIPKINMTFWSERI